MLHAMHYFIKQSLTINHATVKEQAKDGDCSSGQLISFKNLSRQVKHAMLILTHESTKMVMEGLERHMALINPKNAVSWVVAFSVMLILCLCMDEIPATISSIDETFPLRNDLEQERVKFLSFYADLGSHPFGVATTVFHVAYKTKFINPLNDNRRIPNDYFSGWGEQEAAFLAEIRRVIAYHSRDSASEPYISRLTRLILRNWSVEPPRSTDFRRIFARE